MPRLPLLVDPRQLGQPSLVDDVVGTAPDDQDDWAGEARMRGCVALAAAVLLVLTVAVLFMPLAVIGMVFLLADLGIVAMAAGRLLRGRGGDYLIGAGVPAWTLMGVEVARLTDWHPFTLVTCGIAGAALGIAAFSLAADRWLPLAAAGATAMPLALVGTLLLAVGLAPVRAAGILTVLLVLAVGSASPLTRVWSRLVDPAQVDEAGRRPDQHLIEVVFRGPAILAGALWAVAVVAALTAGVLLTSGTGWGLALAATLAAVFALRSRAFSKAVQILPMLLLAVLTGATGLVTVPRWLGASDVIATWVTFVGALGLVGLLLLAARPRLGEAGAARLRRFLGLLEVVAAVALVPLVIGVFGGFDWELS